MRSLAEYSSAKVKNRGRYRILPQMLSCLFGNMLWGFPDIWKRGLNRNMDDVAYVHNDV